MSDKPQTVTEVLLREERMWKPTVVRSGRPPREGLSNVTAVVPVRDGVVFFTTNAHVIYRWRASRLTRLRRFLKI